MKKKKVDQKEKILKVVIISSVILFTFGICFALSTTSGEEYSSSSSTEEIDEENILEVATRDAGEVIDSERIEPTKISIDEYLKLYEGNESSVVLFSRDSCQYCKLSTPILENIIYEYGVDLKYVALENLSDDDKSKLVSSDDYFSEGVSTPLVVVVKDSSIVDKIEGLVTRDNYISFFRDYGFME